MARRAPRDDPGDADLDVGTPLIKSAGMPAVVAALRHANAEMGLRRSALTLLRVNQKQGFDCPGCAWPESGHRHAAEFCENGAKAVAEEATLRRVGPDFFAEHPVSELATMSDHWLGKQGRLTEPMVKRPGSDHYEPISYDAAFDLVADALRTLPSPDHAVFYTSGRTSNEAAFVYQLFVRAYGTNNLPDCSNLCHESSGAALHETLGVGKGSVSLDDFERTDLIVITGQNPGTNHPRMLSTLEAAKLRGARIVAVNPLPEAGLQTFKNPQRVTGVMGHGTPLADRFLQIRLGGDLALFQAAGRLLLERDDSSGTVLDRAFIEQFTTGFDNYAAHVRAASWQDLLAATGLTGDEIDAFVDELVASRRTIVCWAMGLTQHRHAVATIREIVNVLLLQGNLGRPGAGVCPVRGHSNVQGDRTMGIWERPTTGFLDALEKEFGFAPPRDPGCDVVDAVRAMRDGRSTVFFAVGGNFVRATSDSAVTEAAMRRCALTVHVSTKLNRSHTVCGDTAMILPTLGRTERDVRDAGEQVVTVEDSMGQVHASRGRLPPASPQLRSEVGIITSLASRVLGDDVVDWRALGRDYRRIRTHISRVVPGFDGFEAKIAQPGGFALPHPVRDRRVFPTASGKAVFTANALQVLRVPPGRLLLQTIRSHDQFNTTVYGMDDRYRGIKGGRRVVLVNPDDLAALGLVDGQTVDLVSEWVDEVERRAAAFRVVAYPTARGCAAAYFPETNVLVPLDSVAETSNTPTSKSVVVRLEVATQARRSRAEELATRSTDPH
ncbi:MAG: FdhF/YdeP family oxidoreductase [Candidatus Nanopelagicales bacterium]